MKFMERSYVIRCMDVVMGRDDKDVTLFFRVPSYSDLPRGTAEKHRQEVISFLKESFPELREIYSCNNTSEFKAVIPREEFFSRFPEFPKESEDDNVFRKEAEIALKKMFCAKSARIYSEDSGLWETANLVSVRVFPKFPYPLKTDLSVVEDKDVVIVNFPWLAYRFYAPVFENVISLLVKSFKAKVKEEPSVNQETYSTWTKRIVSEDERKEYVANLVRKGLEKAINGEVRFRGKETEIKDSHVDKFVRIVTNVQFRKETQKEKKEVKDRIVPYIDRPFLYVQLLPETYEKVKDEVAKFAVENKLKGGQFVPGRGYMKSYIIGSASTMAGFENRIALAEKLSKAIGVPAEIPAPVVGIYETKDATGNRRVCVRMPKAWDRSVDKSSAHESSKTLDALVKKFQSRDWEPVFPGTYVVTYSLLIPKDAGDEEVEKAKAEAIEIISGENMEYEFVDMKEKRAENAERQIRRNIDSLSDGDLER